MKSEEIISAVDMATWAVEDILSKYGMDVSLNYSRYCAVCTIFGMVDTVMKKNECSSVKISVNEDTMDMVCEMDYPSLIFSYRDDQEFFEVVNGATSFSFRCKDKDTITFEAMFGDLFRYKDNILD